jgi:hypothetical protein
LCWRVRIATYQSVINSLMNGLRVEDYSKQEDYMPVKIGNKEYVLVCERVAAAHADEGFSMLEEETFELHERFFLRLTIEVKGKRYIGTSEIKFDAPRNTPDAQSPIECASTSSLGRALGAAGYGSTESIASADEIARSEPQSRHNGRQDGIMLGQSHDLADRLKAVTERARALGVATTNEQWQALLRYLEISKIRGQAEIDLIESYLSGREEKQKEEASASGK